MKGKYKVKWVQTDQSEVRSTILLNKMDIYSCVQMDTSVQYHYLVEMIGTRVPDMLLLSSNRNNKIDVTKMKITELVHCKQILLL